MRFLVVSEYGEIADVALALEREGHDVEILISDKTCCKIYDGILDKADEWFEYLGKDCIWVFDSCSNGKLQDWLREQGELVFGGSKLGDELENDRQMNQKWFKRIGFKQPESKNFTDIDEAIKFVLANRDKRWILKQNNDLPKSVNHAAHFEDNTDLILHLKDLKKSWNVHEMKGEFDADLMEMVKGIEIAVSAFFNGTDFLRNDDGSIAAFINSENKKECDGDLGETTGEMGTYFYGCTSKNQMVEKVLGSPEVVKVLKEAKFRGVFDINGCLLDDGSYCGFEPTCRFGVPSTSYALIEGLESPLGELIEAVAKGEDYEVKIKKGDGMVLVVAAKPFPIEEGVERHSTSAGEVLWPIVEGKPEKDFTDEQKKHIHLYNFFVNDEGMYEVATKSGYLLTVTGTGESISDCREKLLAYVKENLYVSGMKYRSDLSKKFEEQMAEIEKK